MNVSTDIHYIGVNDHKVDLFEGQYVVPNGIAYNSYVILDEKVAVMDTVDKNFAHEWLDNLQAVLGGRKVDYLVVQHMEPDHSANIDMFLQVYPDAVVVSSEKAFAMMQNFFHSAYDERRIVVGEGDSLNLGKHTLHFVAAPMVHWPEVIVTYDSYDKVLFSADGFGKFGALDVDEPWADEARRYFTDAVQMEPGNPEYRQAYSYMQSASAQPFTTRSVQTGDPCNTCGNLLVLDCCCEMMGGDCVPCC